MGQWLEFEGRSKIDADTSRRVTDPPRILRRLIPGVAWQYIARSNRHGARMKVEPMEASATTAPFVEDVEVRGHIIDSLILPKILDLITSQRRHVSHQADHDRPGPHRPELRADRSAGRRRPKRWPRSWRRSPITAPCPPRSRTAGSCRPTWTAPFPRVSTARRTSGPRSAWPAIGSRSPTRRWTAASSVDADREPARCVPMTDVRSGDLIVVGHAGVRVFPPERAARATPFEFMGSTVSTEKPKGVAIREIARELAEQPRRGRQDAARRRAGHRPHRQRRARLPDDSRRLHRRAVRRQRPGHARHRAGPVRHEPGRASDAGDLGRGRPRASPAGDQPHPPRRRHSPGGRHGRADLGHHVRVRAATTSTSCWPAASATTARCPR